MTQTQVSNLTVTVMNSFDRWASEGRRGTYEFAAAIPTVNGSRLYRFEISENLVTYRTNDDLSWRVANLRDYSLREWLDIQAYSIGSQRGYLVIEPVWGLVS